MRALLLLSFVLGAPFVVAQAPTLPSFSEVVIRDFRDWDHDGDGVLTEAEVDRAALSPRYHGEDAAALAALHTYLAVAKEPPRLTKAWFADYRPAKFVAPSGVSERGLKQARKAYAATPESLQGAYLGDLRRLRKGGNASLFAGDRPDLTDIRQGALGDCYMLAPLGALVHRDPEAVQRMFKPQGDGGYAFSFGDGKTVRVAPPTDAEIAMGGSATTNGQWVRMVEKAYGSRDFAEDANDAKIARDGMNGGNPAKAGRGFTGHPFKSTKLVGGYQKEISSVDLEAKLGAVRKDLTRALADGRLVLAATSREEMPTSINGGHAYAIFGYDAATDTLTLWNPHGNDFKPKGPEGFENGFARKGGVFSMPLPMFARAFARIYFEGSGTP